MLQQCAGSKLKGSMVRSPAFVDTKVFTNSFGDVQAVMPKPQQSSSHGTYLEHTRVTFSSAVDANCPETNAVGMNC